MQESLAYTLIAEAIALNVSDTKLTERGANRIQTTRQLLQYHLYGFQTEPSEPNVNVLCDHIHYLWSELGTHFVLPTNATDVTDMISLDSPNQYNKVLHRLRHLIFTYKNDHVDELFGPIARDDDRDWFIRACTDLIDLSQELVSQHH